MNSYNLYDYEYTSHFLWMIEQSIISLDFHFNEGEVEFQKQPLNNFTLIESMFFAIEFMPDNYENIIEYIKQNKKIPILDGRNYIPIMLDIFQKNRNGYNFIELFKIYKQKIIDYETQTNIKFKPYISIPIHYNFNYLNYLNKFEKILNDIIVCHNYFSQLEDETYNINRPYSVKRARQSNNNY